MSKSKHSAKKEVMDMSTRPLLRKIIIFSVPLILTGILQLLYNAMDIVIVGNFSADPTNEQAAVGATTQLVNLFTNLLMGISVGALSSMSRCIGAGDEERADKVVHSSISISLIGGVIMGIVGVFGARGMLELMGTPANIIDHAAQYLQIYFLGLPFCMVYNFGASIVRACGDTKNPLFILVGAGLINLCLNFAMVAGVHMGAAGVAIGTTVSQFISAVAVICVMLKRKGYGHFRFKKICLEKKAVAEIFKIGLPAGIQSTIFSISNVLIQSSVNGFGEFAIAGNTNSASVEMFVYTSMNAVSQATLAFTARNYGKKNEKNITLATYQSMALVTVIGLVMGILLLFCGRPILSLYNSDPVVIDYAMRRMVIIISLYFLCGLMEVAVGSLRGMGRSVVPMLVSIFGVCVLRVVWIYSVFEFNKTLEVLYLSYPVSWVITASIHYVYYLLVKKKVNKKFAEENIAIVQPPALYEVLDEG